MMATRGFAGIATGQIFDISMIDLSIQPVHFPKNVVVARAIVPPKTIATTKISLIDCKANNNKKMTNRDPNHEQKVIAAVHYKTTIKRYKQIEHYHGREDRQQEAAT